MSGLSSFPQILVFQVFSGVLRRSWEWSVILLQYGCMGLGTFLCYSILMDFVHLCVGPWPKVPHANVQNPYPITTKHGILSFVFYFWFLHHVEEFNAESRSGEERSSRTSARVRGTRASRGTRGSSDLPLDTVDIEQVRTQIEISSNEYTEICLRFTLHTDQNDISRVQTMFFVNRLVDMRERDQQRILGISQWLMTKRTQKVRWSVGWVWMWEPASRPPGPLVEKNMNTPASGETYQLRSRFPAYMNQVIHISDESGQTTVTPLQEGKHFCLFIFIYFFLFENSKIQFFLYYV